MRDTAGLTEPLLPPPDLDRLRAALGCYTADAVQDLLGPIGRAAHERGDLAGVARVVSTGADSRLTTFVRLFLLGSVVPLDDVRAALHPLSTDAAVGAGLIEVSGDEARALLEIRPYAETGSAEQWWVVSDLGSDVRPGPLAADHVLGIGNAALTLAQATPRSPVGSALDIGTGCGVQALHLGRHAGRVVATDISGRALRFAATGAALSGQSWDLRRGSFVRPVEGETFDLVVANPPFVVSPGATGGGRADFDYRDSGLAGDEVCRTLTGDMFGLLAPGGTGQLLANWIVPVEGTWQERVTGWFPPGCDAWVWQREVADLGEYVTMWLRDAGFAPGTTPWTQRYDAWLEWFTANGVAAVGMGLITMWRDPIGGSGGGSVGVVAEDVPQAVAQPVGPEVAGWIGRSRLLASSTDDELVRRDYRPPDDLVRTRADLIDVVDAGWHTRHETLRQTNGMRWELEVDEAVARVVAACAAGATPLTALEVLAAMTDDDADDLARRFAPVLRDLVRRGLLLPEQGR